MMPMILTVYLSNNDRQGIEVPITPETCCKDVMDFCKEPGELQCRLVQLWRGDERALSAQEGIFDLLQQWGARRDEVKFFLRHDVASLGSRDPGRTVGGHVAGHPASGTKQEMKDLSVITEAQRLQQLRERVESQEAKIRKLRSMRGLPEHPKVLNHNLLAELSTMNGFLAEKQRELAAAVTRVDELTKQLESVRSGRPDGHQLGLGRQLASAVLDLDRLYRELQMRNRVSQQQQQPQQQRNGETAEMERRVGELRQQMLRKKAAMAAGDPRSASECSRLLGTRIATVGPFQTNVRPDGPESTAYKAYPSNQQLVAQCGVGNDNAKPEETDKGTITKGAWAESNLDGSDAVAVHPRGVLSAHPEPSSLPAHPGVPLTHERQLMGGMDWKESSLDIPAKGPTQSTSPGPLGFDVGIASRVSKTDLSLATTSTAQDAPGHRQSWAGIGSSVLPKPQPPGPMEQPRPAFIRFQGTLERRIPQPGQQSRLQGPGQATGWPWSGGGVHALQKGHLSAPQSLQEVPRTSRQIQQRIAVPPSTTSVQPQRSSSPALSSNSSSSSSLQQLFQPSSITTHTVSPSPTHSGPVHSLDSHSSSPGPLAERSQSPRKLAPPLSLNSSSIMSMYTQQAQQPRFLQQALINAMGKAQGRQSPALPRIAGPPAPPRGTAYDQQYNPTNFYGMMKPLSPDELDRKMERPRSASGMNWGLEPQRPLSPTKLLPFSMSPLRGQGDADLEALRRKLAHAPRPLKKRSSFAEPESPAGSSMSNLMHLSNVPSLLLQKLHYQRVTLAGLEGTVQGQGVPHHANQEPSAVTTHPSFLEYQSQYGRPSHGEVPHGPGSDPQSPPPVPAPPSNELTGDLAELTEPSSFNRNGGEAPPIPPLPQEVSEDPSCELDTLHEQVDFGAIEEEAESGFRFSDSYASDEEDLDFIDDLEPPVVYPPIIPPDKRTNLKKVGSERTNSGIRVKFNPLALLLDASLEGEFDLVQRIIYEVDNPSHPNDEGITALHNAVCAGHVAIVRFLIQFGVNVNAGDSDGWTPLHCAASCNSTSMCRLLVESGAAPFATTQSDMETAAEKCDDFEEGYEECFQFLYGVQEKMGVMNKGLVYVLWSWDAEAPDELSIHEGEQLLVLRRGDKDETEWWWLQQGDKEGYVPRNMLGLFPRIRPRQRSLA